MEFSSLLVTNLIRAIALGLGVALLLWLLRPLSFTARIRASALGAAGIWGLYLILLEVESPDVSFVLKLVLAVGLLLATNIAVQLFDLLLWDYFLNRRRQARVPRLLMEIFNLVVLLAVGLAILNRVFGVDLNALLVTSTVVSAVIGLALQDMLSNLISGLALQLDRPFDIGDWINTNGQEGEVIRMNWRTITIRNIDSQTITLANANMVKQDIVNFSRPTKVQRLHVRVGLPYGVPPGEIKRVLLPAVRSVEGVLDKPPPDVLTYEYGDSAIIYDVRYWIDTYELTPEIRDGVLSRIWYAIRRAGISVPFPIRDVTVRQINDEVEQAARVRLNQDIYQQLRPLAIFSPLEDAQIDQLAANATLHRYHAGENLVRQGEVGDSLFVIKSGTARVDVISEAGVTTKVAVRGPNDFFGEMSLLTGESRSADVVAETEMEVIVVDKDALADVLSTDLAGLKALSEIVEDRLHEAQEAVAAASPGKSQGSELLETSLFARIGRFLGLNS